MSDQGGEGSSLRITLRDVWDAQNATTAAINGVNLTMGAIKSHIETIDNRNALADLAHHRFESELRAIQDMVLSQNLKTIRDDMTVRLDPLEKNQISVDAVTTARKQSRASLWIALGALAAAITAIFMMLQYLKPK